MRVQSPRGTKDLYGVAAKHHAELVALATRVAASYGFDEIITPIIEFANVFERNLGQDSDVVNKEIYRFEDRGGETLALRPEFTAGVVRAAICNNLIISNKELRLFSSGPLFRYDRPQKGRQRQFNQVNFEIIGGGDSFIADLDIIMLAKQILGELSIVSKLELNYLGSKSVIENYNTQLTQFFVKRNNELSDDSKRRLASGKPLRILDSKAPVDQIIAAEAPLISECYGEIEKLYLAKMVSYLTQLGIDFVVNHKMVRGLDYYTGLIFEFKSEELGAQSTIIAGGRYDCLVEQMGGKATNAVGMAAGLERLMLLTIPADKNPQRLALATIGENDLLTIKALEIVSNMRKNNIPSNIISGSSLTKKLKTIASDGYKYAAILGEDELANDKIILKNLILHKQEIVDINQLHVLVH